ncbi:MAG TPA: hypothetical protein VK050_11970 [Flavobacteriaceae bacterium]|nr:hypothetical protein [Flavobacteriaceae bacterium]
MKALVAISLSFLVFFQSVGMDVSDIFMLTDLVEHAKFHSEVHGDDFFTFLDKHYGTLKAEHEKTAQDESQKHEKLPFQHKNCQHLLTEVAVINNTFSFKKSEVYYPTKHHFYYKDLYSFLEKVSIFQPPRTA